MKWWKTPSDADITSRFLTCGCCLIMLALPVITSFTEPLPSSAILASVTLQVRQGRAAFGVCKNLVLTWPPPDPRTVCCTTTTMVPCAASFPPAICPPGTEYPQEQCHRRPQLSGGAIAAIVSVGVVIVVLLIGFAFWKRNRRLRKSKAKAKVKASAGGKRRDVNPAPGDRERQDKNEQGEPPIEAPAPNQDSGPAQEVPPAAQEDADRLAAGALVAVEQNAVQDQGNDGGGRDHRNHRKRGKGRNRKDRRSRKVHRNRKNGRLSPDEQGDEPNGLY